VIESPVGPSSCFRPPASDCRRNYTEPQEISRVGLSRNVSSGSNAPAYSLLRPFAPVAKRWNVMAAALFRSFPRRLYSADAFPNRKALFRLFRQVSCGSAARFGRPQAAPCAIATPCAVRIFRLRPARGLLRKEKSLRHGALASRGLPARSPSPPVHAPAGFMLVRRCAVQRTDQPETFRKEHCHGEETEQSATGRGSTHRQR